MGFKKWIGESQAKTEALCDWLLQNATVYFGSGSIKQRERLLKLLNENRLAQAAVEFIGDENDRVALKLPYGLPKARWISVDAYVVPDIPLESVNGYEFTECIVADAVIDRIEPGQSVRLYGTRVREDALYRLIEVTHSLNYSHTASGSILGIVSGKAASESGYSKTAKIVVLVGAQRTKHLFDDIFEMQDWMIQNGFTGPEYFK